MRVHFSERTKEAVKVVLQRALGLVVLVYFVAIFLLLAFTSYIANLVDAKLIVSLWISEVPLAFMLSYFLGERRRTKVEDAAEHARAVRDFAHLKVHKFSNPFFIPWHYVENVATKCAYKAPDYFVVLVNDDAVELVRHRTEKEMLDYFASNRINLENRYPTPSELT